MMKIAKARTLGMVALTGLLGMATNVAAQEITLKSSDGTVNMTGEYLDFVDNAYVIQTALGQLRVSASRVSCSGAACPEFNTDEADVVMSGADTIGIGLMPLMLEGYAGSLGAAASIGNTGQPGEIVATLVADQGFGDDIAAIKVSPSGSTQGFADLLEETTEIAMAARRIDPAEAQALANAGAGNMISTDQEHIIAVDSLIIITNPENPIKTLDVRQLLGIYSGAITNWAQVGGPDLPVEVVIRNVGQNRRDAFESRIFGANSAGLTPDANLVANSNEVAQFVNANPGGIGVVGLAFQRGANTVNVINQCGITMVPDAFSAKTEEYALQRRLFLYTRNDTLSAQAKQFVDFATSVEADALIRKAGFIGFSVDRREQTLDDVRVQALLAANAGSSDGAFMREMVNTMVGYDRLSTTFRFQTGSSQLDERGVIEKERLVDYLEAQPAGSEVLVVGFTDEVGSFESNLALSRLRAEQVTDQLKSVGGDRLSGISFSSTGYSEIAPAGCNSSEDGRRINRRVEIWIKSPA